MFGQWQRKIHFVYGKCQRGGGFQCGVTCFCPHIGVSKTLISTHTLTHTRLPVIVHFLCYTHTIKYRLCLWHSGLQHNCRSAPTHLVRCGFGKTPRQNNKHCKSAAAQLKLNPSFRQTGGKCKLIKEIKITGGSRGSNREMLSTAGCSRCAGFSRGSCEQLLGPPRAKNADSAGRLQRLPVDSCRLHHNDYFGHFKLSSNGLQKLGESEKGGERWWRWGSDKH